MIGVIIIKSIIVGFIGGSAIAAGASRMFHAPESQGMGSFRGLGEFHACQGDPIGHLSFGFGFILDAAASSVSTGVLGSEVYHRIVPNITAGLALLRNKERDKSIENPFVMAIIGGFVGATILTLLNTMSTAVPEKVSKLAAGILGNAAGLMVDPIMPLVFWLAAMDSGRTTGMTATALGGISHMVSGNSLPGLVLGILIGKNIEEKGFDKTVKIMILVVAALFITIAYFRGFFNKF